MSIQVSGGGGGLPLGVTGDGLTPGGLTVAGALTAGDAAATGAPNFHAISGALAVIDTAGNLDDVDATLSAFQQQGLTSDNGSFAFRVVRTGILNGHTYQLGALGVVDTTGGASNLLLQFRSMVVPGHTGSLNDAVTASAQGGLGLFGHTPPTASRTLPQATIDAITDANAKAATQACANALADMGALTLT